MHVIFDRIILVKSLPFSTMLQIQYLVENCNSITVLEDLPPVAYCFLQEI